MVFSKGLVVTSKRLVVFSKRLVIFSKGLVVFSKPLVVFLKGLVVSAKRLVVFSKGLVVFQKPLVVSANGLVVSSRLLSLLSKIPSVPSPHEAFFSESKPAAALCLRCRPAQPWRGGHPVTFRAPSVCGGLFRCPRAGLRWSKSSRACMPVKSSSRHASFWTSCFRTPSFHDNRTIRAVTGS